MNDHLLADIQQLFAASEDRLFRRVELLVDQKIEALAVEMRAGFAGVADAIEQIHLELAGHQYQLTSHDKRIRKLETDTQKS